MIHADRRHESPFAPAALVACLGRRSTGSTRSPRARRGRGVSLPALGIAAALLVTFPLAGCRDENNDGGQAGGSGTAAADNRPVVMTTFYPTTYFAERIVGDTLKVVCLLPDGEDPKNWQPADDVITRYQQADVIIVNGAEFEDWIATSNLPTDRIIDTAQPLSNSFIVMESETHSHGSAGEHTHEGVDPHTWVDPVMAKQQAQRIADTLSERFPEHKAAFAANMAELAADLDRLDARFQALTPRLEGALLTASHPAYNYPAARYGWTIHNIFVDPGAPLNEASARDIVKVLEQNALQMPRIMLFEERPLPELREELQLQFDMRSVIFSPAEAIGSVREIGGENADYLTTMSENLDRLEAALPAEG